MFMKDSIENYHNIELIAKHCHELNRKYCASLGDNSQTSWEDAPDWQKQSAILGVKMHLNDLLIGKKPDPKESHANWLLIKERDGWKYGSVKDPEKKEHPCMVPYDELPPEQKFKDDLFIGIIEAFYLNTYL